MGGGEEVKNYSKNRLMIFEHSSSVEYLPSQDNLLQKQFIDMVSDGNARSLFSENLAVTFGLKWHKLL